MNTTVIDLYGGPGLGKSVMAAEVYVELSKRGESVELVREYVKTWAWNKIPIKKWDEHYILSKQLKAEADLYGKVKYLVTDRPLGLSVVYSRMYGKDKGVRMRQYINSMLEEQKQDGVTHLPFLLRRLRPYDSAGRFETSEQAVRVDQLCRDEHPGAQIVREARQVLNCGCL